MFCPSILFINLTRLRWTIVKLGYIKIRPAHVDAILCVNTAVYLTKSEAMSHRARLLFSKQVSPTRARACVGVVGWLANVYKREWEREEGRLSGAAGRGWSKSQHFRRSARADDRGRSGFRFVLVGVSPGPDTWQDVGEELLHLHLECKLNPLVGCFVANKFNDLNILQTGQQHYIIVSIFWLDL